MNLEMFPIEIVGLKEDLHLVIQSLRTLECMHVDDLSDSPQVSARPLSLDLSLIHI